MDVTHVTWQRVLAVVLSPVVVALVAQVSAQGFKVVFYSIRERRWAFDRFINASGMPSAHTAFVTALAATVGVHQGVDSEVFAVAFVLAAVVVYDSFRLRGQVQRHAEVLNRLLEREQNNPQFSVWCKEKRLNEHIGHTLPEVLAGIAWGGTVAVLWG